MIILAAMIVLFLAIGGVMMTGRGSFLIAGFNTMPTEEKEKYNETALCKFMGKMMFALAFSMLFWLFSVAYDIHWLLYVGLILFLFIVAFMVIFMNTGSRFKR
ncbi:hypothetical protein NCCP2716_28500 [Sporosarcina sp. NCCP-2716]|uniref:DUF3784 domain-containing protein n=1 Tax=Sporosarcina sp. NCCP-2716 TaxID=2943679 RepID=UPI002040AD62|nr:DUF3784 domain-containing protein [Sporosarcina sp. NCCP-2716]GKV70352.1 hypothetical protein NCCP2716_28500 [Sporosarcina sp. NCCP-2716]